MSKKTIQLNTVNLSGGTTKGCNCNGGVAPIINKDTNTWLVWDNEKGMYVDTGVVAGVGTEDFYASTYWVFNEIASGKKIIAKALTDRRYPTNNDESFADMAQKITDMSYGLGIFEKIGYTENNNDVAEKVNYSYELAKGWKNDGSTAQMFSGNKRLTYLPVIDTSNVTSMSSMFKGCSALTTIPLLDMGKVTSVISMFENCSALTTIPLLDTSNVTSMDSTFRSCSALITIPLLDTSNVASLYSAFAYCSALTTIPLLDMGKVTNMSASFTNCLVLGFLKITNLGKSTLVTYDFSGVTAWGVGGEENRQSLIDSLITYSHDRASNGMATATIKLSTNTKALLTDEEIAQITAKGFTIV